MINFLFIAVVVVLLLCLIIGACKGFVRSVSFLFSTYAAAALAIILIVPMTSFIMDRTGIDEKVSGKIEEKIVSILPEGVTADMTSQLTTVEQMTLIDQAPFPQVLKNRLIENNNNSMYDILGIHNFVEYISVYIAGIVVKIITFLVAFVVFLLVLRLIFRIIEKASRRGYLAALNRMAGAVVGIVTGLVFVWALFLVIMLCCTTSWGQSLLAMVEENPFLSYLFKYNAILMFLK